MAWEAQLQASASVPRAEVALHRICMDWFCTSVMPQGGDDCAQGTAAVRQDGMRGIFFHTRHDNVWYGSGERTRGANLAHVAHLACLCLSFRSVLTQWSYAVLAECVLQDSVSVWVGVILSAVRSCTCSPALHVYDLYFTWVA